jgi:hypothetical protein
MRELTFKTFFERFVPMIGRSAEEFPCGSVDGERHCAAITAAVRRAYEHEFWPEIMVIDERTPSVDYLVEQAEDGEVEIDVVQGFFQTESDARNFSRLIHAERIPGGWILDKAYDSVFVRFRPVAPRFTRVKWDAAKTYAANDVVYLDTNGKCYRSTNAGSNKYPETETTYWSEQAFPGFFEQYAQYAAAAENWRFERQWSQAGEIQSRADDTLFRLKSSAKGQGGTL